MYVCIYIYIYIYECPGYDIQNCHNVTKMLQNFWLIPLVTACNKQQTVFLLIYVRSYKTFQNEIIFSEIKWLLWKKLIYS